MSDDHDDGFDEEASLGTRDVVVLERDDGTQVECIVLAIVEHEGVDYALLVPRSGEEDEEAEDDDEVVREVMVARWEEAADGTPLLGTVDDDAVIAALRVALENLVEFEPEERATAFFRGPTPEA